MDNSNELFSIPIPSESGTFSVYKGETPNTLLIKLNRKHKNQITFYESAFELKKLKELNPEFFDNCTSVKDFVSSFKKLRKGKISLNNYGNQIIVQSNDFNLLLNINYNVLNDCLNEIGHMKNIIGTLVKRIEVLEGKENHKKDAFERKEKVYEEEIITTTKKPKLLKSTEKIDKNDFNGNLLGSSLKKKDLDDLDNQFLKSSNFKDMGSTFKSKKSNNEPKDKDKKDKEKENLEEKNEESIPNGKLIFYKKKENHRNLVSANNLNNLKNSQLTNDFIPQIFKDNIMRDETSPIKTSGKGKYLKNSLLTYSSLPLAFDKINSSIINSNYVFVNEFLENIFKKPVYYKTLKVDNIFDISCNNILFIIKLSNTIIGSYCSTILSHKLNEYDKYCFVFDDTRVYNNVNKKNNLYYSENYVYFGNSQEIGAFKISLNMKEVIGLKNGQNIFENYSNDRLKEGEKYPVENIEIFHIIEN